jgi:DNA-binding response OmpR family regulator
MPSIDLMGHRILIVEDEALIALDLASAFEDAGAIVSMATTLAEGLHRVEEAGLSAAVLDYGLRDGDCDALCTRLTARGIPFVFHSGFAHSGISQYNAVLIPKPADPITIVAAVHNQLRLELAAPLAAAL